MEVNPSDRTSKIILVLNDWLKQKGSKDSLNWLQSKVAEIASKETEKTLFAAYSAVSRYYQPKQLNLSSEELQALPVAGWNPSNWTLDQVARSLLLLSFPSNNVERYAIAMDKIITAADVSEAIAFYQTLPLFPHPEQFLLRTAEGIRTNMTSVFNAVAHHNPYPAKYLDDLAWNQMVLKALFVGSPLHSIYGLEQRNNSQLAQMLIDYARERLAANRTVSNELWDLVEPFKPETVSKLKAATMPNHV